MSKPKDTQEELLVSNENLSISNSDEGSKVKDLRKESNQIAETRIRITNPNRYMVPTTKNSDEGLMQLNIEPRSSVDLDQKEITDSIVNLVNRKILVLKQI